MAQSVTLSSAGTATMVLNPVAKATTVILTVTSGSSNATVQIEGSVADPTQPGGPSAIWGTISSGTAMLSSQITSLVYTVASPICQLRINSTLLSSQASFAMQALQAVTA